MPLLTAEASWYPDGLFHDENLAPPTGHLWWALHVRPRQEKSLARELLGKQLAFYLPLVSRRWRSQGRPMTSHLPLFAGYLFLRCTRDGRLGALATNRVVRCLDVAQQDLLWRDLRQIHRLIGAGAPLTPESKLTPGTPVEIASGPLMGLRGKVLRTASGRRFIVEVDFIRRGASVMLDDHVLTRLD